MKSINTFPRSYERLEMREDVEHEQPVPNTRMKEIRKDSAQL